MCEKQPIKEHIKTVENLSQSYVVHLKHEKVYENRTEEVISKKKPPRANHVTDAKSMGKKEQSSYVHYWINWLEIEKKNSHHMCYVKFYLFHIDPFFFRFKFFSFID